jgi:hypothetical protein
VPVVTTTVVPVFTRMGKQINYSVHELLASNSTLINIPALAGGATVWACAKTIHCLPAKFIQKRLPLFPAFFAYLWISSSQEAQKAVIQAKNSVQPTVEKTVEKQAMIQAPDSVQPTVEKKDLIPQAVEKSDLAAK